MKAKFDLAVTDMTIEFSRSKVPTKCFVIFLLLLTPLLILLSQNLCFTWHFDTKELLFIKYLVIFIIF